MICEICENKTLSKISAHTVVFTSSMSVDKIDDLLLALLLLFIRQDVDNVGPDGPLGVGVQDREDLHDQTINVSGDTEINYTILISN